MYFLVLFCKSTFNGLSWIWWTRFWSFHSVQSKDRKHFSNSRPINSIRNRVWPPSHSELLEQQNGFESLHFLPSLIMDDLPLHETFQTDPFPFLDPSVIHCASLLPYPLIWFLILSAEQFPPQVGCGSVGQPDGSQHLPDGCRTYPFLQPHPGVI